MTKEFEDKTLKEKDLKETLNEIENKMYEVWKLVKKIKNRYIKEN